jgi:hypothetical protein
MDTKTINLRDLPEEFVRRAKVQAAMGGMTLKDFVIKAVEKAIQDELPADPKADSKRRRKKQ